MPRRRLVTTRQRTVLVDRQPDKISRWIAVAAIVATVVVGLGGSFTTWRAGIGAQRAASRDERVRTDLIELRAVLDSSLSHARILQSTIAFALTPWTKTGQLSRARSLPIARSFEVAQRDRDRLAIRLGTKSPLYRYYTDAVVRTYSAGQLMQTGDDSPEAPNEFSARYNAGNRALVRFRNAALRLAGSRL
jgi:hypothetical protein